MNLLFSYIDKTNKPTYRATLRYTFIIVSPQKSPIRNNGFGGRREVFFKNRLCFNCYMVIKNHGMFHHLKNC